ncbi:Transcription termination factor MTEF18, mitochondrial [Sesamum alatum]|uniref:Transcription termination factor MTEF18, mitochondrial n=1 Tax=Sesamum alatum TaxID=300844 RepID=A0AAE1YM56_9LAMI|nr:Transcription termination factor MTEF18, mitochondrial [Sesamum alatum]
MTSLQKLRKPHFLKSVSLLCSGNNSASPKSHLYVNGSLYILQLFRFCSVERAVNLRNGGDLGELAKKSRVVRREAQAALLEYLHSTRSLQFMDAENMSKNTPEFLDRLLKRVDMNDGDVGRSLTRFLRYHPINEFEPFFESIGLDPSEYASFLPRNLMFLSDDQLLLQNYCVLCNYGIPRNRIGKIFKEAMEVFRYDYGILQSKLQSFQNLGLKQSLVVKIIASSPYLLKGDVNRVFLEFLEKLKNSGVGYNWLEEHLSEGDSYNWKCMLELICLLGELGLTGEILGEVITHHPDLLLEHSGRTSFCLFGFLLKFGSTPSDIRTLFLQFPSISVVKFTNNLCQCYKFLVEIKMSVQDIGRMFRSFPLLLGTCELKKVTSLLGTLNCGLNRLCQMVKDDPYVLEKWVRGVKVDRLPGPKRVLKVRMLKTKFLLSLGFVEKSKEMERALKVFRGKGVELQERFDCLVNNGLSREDVIEMLKVSPQILNQTKDVIEKKIEFFVKDMGYPVSALCAHPALVSYKIQRVKLRLLTYKWLKDQQAVHPKLALSTLFLCSEEIFVKSYVKSHPRGLEFWESLKKKVFSE